MADSALLGATAPILRRPPLAHMAMVALILVVILGYESGTNGRGFPSALQYSLRDFVEEFTYWISDLLRFFLRPIGAAIKFSLAQLDAFVLALPWPVLVLGVFLLVAKVGGIRLALFSAGSLMFIGSLGLWESSIKTLNIMAVSIVITLLIGIPLGVWASRSDKVEFVLRPILDTMQTLPTFVYLIPVMLLFGLGAPAAVVATIIYSVSPIIRLTNLGIRQVSSETVEAAKLFGSSYRQMLFKVLLPLAKPSIVIGFNQTVMMALAMVVFVALIGASGLGKEILVAMRRLHVGHSLEAGLAVVVIAICLDRIGNAIAGRSSKDRTDRLNAQSRPPSLFDGRRNMFAEYLPGIANATQAIRYGIASSLAVVLAAVLRPLLKKDLSESLRPPLERHVGLVLGTSVLVALLIVDSTVIRFGDWPSALNFRFHKPVDAAVSWMNVNLTVFTDAVRYFVHTFGLGPMKSFLFWVPWPVLILTVVYVSYIMAGWPLAVLSLVGWIFIGVVGMWVPTMLTLSQLVAALAFSLAIAVPIGILASCSDRFEAIIRPVLDLLQTLPAFVYFPLVIMLFKIGDLSGTIITVVYAIPPAVRLTNLGLRQVPEEVIEAARSYGSTPLQILLKVKLPLALPSIMMGVNQTTMMCLAMVVYASLIGARGLGAEVLLAIGRFDIGLGFEAGMSIVFLAVIADRITQGWAQKRQQALGMTARME